jgi:arylsulfatase A
VRHTTTPIFRLAVYFVLSRLGHGIAAIALSAAAVIGLLGSAGRARAAEPPSEPNVIIVYADDLGYRDLGCFGAPKIRTPHIDRLASEGMRFTDFYVAQAVCSASRTALLTGCYPNRVGILGALGPKSKEGISDRDQTLAEVFKERGYATAIYGKWHLGHHPQVLPTRHGFDDYFGLPYSNDMWPHHPTAGRSYPPLPLIEGESVIATNPDQSQLTTWYTEHAVRFITAHQAEPFFLYLPHSMPHVPLHVSEKFRGQSDQGLYGDVIMVRRWLPGAVPHALAGNDSGRTGVPRASGHD